MTKIFTLATSMADILKKQAKVRVLRPAKQRSGLPLRRASQKDRDDEEAAWNKANSARNIEAAIRAKVTP